MSMDSKGKLQKIRECPGLLCQTLWKVARDDPRRLVYAVKVGQHKSPTFTACTSLLGSSRATFHNVLLLVSLLFTVPQLFSFLGESAILAVLNVFVVLEYKAGASLYKCVNTTLGTLIAASLSFLIEYIADTLFSFLMLEAILFVVGAVCTYIKFVSRVKENYDHGVVIFILTFSFLLVPSLSYKSPIDLAQNHFLANVIGYVICLLTLFIFPKWWGEELHNSTVKNL